VGKCLELLRLLGRLFLDGPLLRDHRRLRVGQGDDRDEGEGGHDGDDRRGPREPRGEQARDHAQRRQGVGPLASHEAIGLGGLVTAGAGGRGRIGTVGGDRRRPGRGRERHGQLQGARQAVAEATLDVDGQGRLAEARARAQDGDEIADAHHDRDGDGDRTRDLEGHEPRDRPQRELRDEEHGQGDPRPTDDAPEPQPAAVRGEAGPDLQEGRVQRLAGQRDPRVGRDDGSR
jgi:hypothetical protein